MGGGGKNRIANWENQVSGHGGGRMWGWGVKGVGGCAFLGGGGEEYSIAH